jgi:ABC-type polysaccharide/polyol phosphate export permease
VEITANKTTNRPVIYDSNAAKYPIFTELRELYRYRFLLINLISRDLKIRYKRSSIGFLWVMLNPLFTMLVMWLVFTKIARFGGGITHYPIYLLCGILFWNVFAQGSVTSMGSLQAGGSLLRKIYVPPSIFVISSIGGALINLLFALVPFIGITLLAGLVVDEQRLYPSWSWFFLPVPALFVTIFALGVGLVISALFVFFNDVSEIYQVLLNLFYFLTPIFYKIDALVGDKSGLAIIIKLERFNPMNLYIEMARISVLDQTLPPFTTILSGFCFAIGILVIGWAIFTRVEDKFAYQF